MEVHYNIDQLPSFNNVVLTIGTFDGVHHGHRIILEQIVKKAKEINGESVLMTFEPHPRQVVFPNDDTLKIISTLAEKIKLLETTKIDHLIVYPFSVEFSQINPALYIEEVLIKKIKAKHIIIGYDHKFGLNRSGDINFLKEYAAKGHFTVEEISEQQIDQLKVSSSKIRQHLLNGEIEKANIQLQHPYVITGVIKRGLNLAGSLGYPTANIKIENYHKLIPAHGTYAARCILSGELYEGMVYIGKGKTLQKEDRLSIEMNIFHSFDQPFYKEHLEIHLLKFIRTDQIFDSKEELLYNIHTDKVECQNYFNLEMSERPKCTIAVLNWNGRKHLQEYIGSLINSSKDNFDLVVIDNGSTDDSVQFIKNNYPSVEIIQLSENYGFAQGYNEGLKQIKTKYIALVNSDIRGTKHWVDPIIALMESDHNIGATQPKILSDLNKSTFEYAGASGGYMDTYGYPFCRGRVFDNCENDHGQYDTTEEIFWATGAAIVVRNDIFKLLNGFDGDFFAHMEEVDLCWRIKKLGYSIMVQPTSLVYHLGGGTLNYNTPNKTFLNFRNNWWMLQKNLEVSRTRVFLVRIILDIVFLFLNLVKGKWSHTKSIVRALKSAYSHRSEMASRRRINGYSQNRYKTNENLNGMHAILSPWRYFVLGKKTYNQIIK